MTNVIYILTRDGPPPNPEMRETPVCNANVQKHVAACRYEGLPIQTAVMGEGGCAFLVSPDDSEPLHMSLRLCGFFLAVVVAARTGARHT